MAETVTCPDRVVELVERFERNAPAYRDGRYKEERLRVEFLNPFFKALGWDVDNTKGYAEAYKDVVHEDRIRIGGKAKAPDYSFRIGGQRKFFVEAKKPSVNIEQDVRPAYQLRRYAWSAKLPLSILTDFEELAVYDTRVKPDKGDPPRTARVMYMNYREYPERWEEIASIFAKEAILMGSFDKYAEKEDRRGTEEVDDAFLEEIEAWREALAIDVAHRNPELSERELNFAVQRTIDRIIFLRICEDRAIEPYGKLKELVDREDVYKALVKDFRQADDRYNSGLFHFKEDSERGEHPDKLTPQLNVSGDVLRDMLGDLYYPESPYEFSVLPTDILGQVYERFLGKVIELGEDHEASVKAKPEVRKAGGVYYTPTYIVDYIVEETIGPLLEGKDWKQARELRIVDPACGSGSFLIGAYQYLLDWHLQHYIDTETETHARGRPPRVYKDPRGEWQLTTQEKKRILLDNIYGVDIDRQAVEVTKLSLLLKMLEGESGESLDNQLQIFQERVLPDLSGNIKCGNSLIDSRFYEGVQMDLLDEEMLYRVNVFDWEDEFAEVFEEGGFDAAIGNPPYIRIQHLRQWASEEATFYKERFESSYYNFDIYLLFVERALQVLSGKGRLGYILPHKFFNSRYGEKLRGIISEGDHLSKVVHFGDEQVFPEVTTYTCLLFLEKGGREAFEYVEAHDLEAWRLAEEGIDGEVPAETATEEAWTFVVGQGADLFYKLDAIETVLEDVTDRIFQGLKTSADKIYIVKEIEREEGRVLVHSPQKDDRYWLEPDLLHPLIKGGDSKRYRMRRTKRCILHPYAALDGGEVDLIPADVFETRYPLSWQYLNANKEYLENRERGRMVGPKWYGYVYPKALDVMPLPKIFTPDIAPRASYSLDPTGEVFFTGGAAGGYGILPADGISRAYLLALLNSRILDWYLHRITTEMQNGYFSYESRFISYLPIVVAEEARRRQIRELSERMLELSERLDAAQTGHDQRMLERQIKATDRQIDRLVYELYDLTDEEIEIVESSLA